MKKIYSIVVLLLSFAVSNAQVPTLQQLWDSSEALPVPESVLYLPDREELFVSLIDGQGNVKDGKGGIALLNTDGSVKNAEWVTGLNAPKGMALYKDLLYIADITAVVVVDIVTANIIDEIEIEGSVFLNDVTVDSEGAVYVSDTRVNKIYRIKNSKYDVYMDNVASANGLKIIDDNLYVLAGKELWKIDEEKNVAVIAEGFEQNGDGIEPAGDGDFLVTCWAGIIYYVQADGTLTKLLDVQGKMNTADLGYHPGKKIVYIPTFNNNSVVAYQLK
ncbi:MAG TPA: ATP-binding protein [Sphingobacterium sp.]|nr:ATP-binding protein [Sphingobacterium sp.]